jgi:gamma-glutamyl hydrolase
MFASDDSDTVLIEGLKSDDENFVLHYAVDPADTRLYGPLGNDAQVLADRPLTYNHHTFGVSPNRFLTDRGLAEMYTPTAISYDTNGIPFVASMESKAYPFFGVQFHPEKPQYSFFPTTKLDHSDDSIYYNRYFADFMVHQARQNANRFPTYAAEAGNVTENWEVIATEGYYGPVFAF